MGGLNMKVGMGYDVHRLVADRELWIGGVRIEHTMGLLGHSDADVLIHALCDALLGAASLRDIGYHFPDKNPEYKGIDSKILLRKVMSLLRDNGYEFGNADMTLCAERPTTRQLSETFTRSTYRTTLSTCPCTCTWTLLKFPITPEYVELCVTELRSYLTS